MRITADDMLAAHRLVHGRRRRGRLVRSAAIAGVGLVLMVLLPADMRRWLGLCVGIIVAGELAQLVIEQVWIPRRIARLHAQHRALHDSIDARVADDGLHVTTRHATATLPWSHVQCWHDGPEHIVLMQTDALMTVLPRRDFDATDLDRLRALLATHVGPAGRTR